MSDYDFPILTAPRTPRPATAPDAPSGVAGYEGEYQVIGPPGTGKTTFIKHQVEKIMAHYHGDAARKQTHPNPILVCSLTRTAAHEAASRVLGGPHSPSKTHVGTLHSHAFRLLGGPGVATGTALDDFNQRYPGYALDTGGGSVDAASDLMPASRGDGPRGQVLLETYDLCRHREQDPDTLPEHTRKFVDLYEGWKAETGLVDFTDMIQRAIDGGPGLLGDRPPRVLLADEAQDLSALEFRLARVWGEACGAMIVVGDPQQALYEWRGGDHSQLSERRVDSSHRRVLGQSYRVPRAVVDSSTRWVSRLSDYERADYKPRDGGDGHAGRLGLSMNQPAALAGAVAELEARGSVMVQATCAYMLHGLVKQLRAEGVPFSNPWRRRNGAWNPLAASAGTSYAAKLGAFLLPSRAIHGSAARSPTWRELNHWVSTLSAPVFDRRGVKADVADRAESDPESVVGDAEWATVFGPQAFDLLAMMDPPDAGAAAEAVLWLTTRATPKLAKGAEYIGRCVARRGVRALIDEPRVFVGTVNSFKGAEADTAILFPDLSPKAMEHYRGGGSSADPVVRTMYVGMTRAKETLLVGSPTGSYAADVAGAL